MKLCITAPESESGVENFFRFIIIFKNIKAVKDVENAAKKL